MKLREPIEFDPCLKFLGGDVECCNGVAMDVDEYREGWNPETIYPPCSCNPNGCKRCKGTGFVGENRERECSTCDGTGWKKSIGYQPPDSRYAAEAAPAPREDYSRLLEELEADGSETSRRAFEAIQDLFGRIAGLTGATPPT